jgi:23S rRNA (cytidine1920-2'-O)/16S rRNA (cytidine1409-2'-O)-methyltransferase
VLAGRVIVSGAPATKPERLVDPAEPIEMAGPPAPFVSRGGEKLDAVLDELGIDVRGRRCLDIGSSTGGFTDCLLKRGASAAVAVDVGRGQLAWSLRTDERVTVLEQTDVRDAAGRDLGEFGLAVADLSFISLRTVLAPIAALAGRAPILALVKPQFEVGRRRVGKGGVVRDPALHQEAIAVVATSAERMGLSCVAAVPSALPGAEGNREFFLLMRRYE